LLTPVNDRLSCANRPPHGSLRGMCSTHPSFSQYERRVGCAGSGCRQHVYAPWGAQQQLHHLHWRCPCAHAGCGEWEKLLTGRCTAARTCTLSPLACNIHAAAGPGVCSSSDQDRGQHPPALVCVAQPHRPCRCVQQGKQLVPPGARGWSISLHATVHADRF
jgi:hypothetical protein